MYEEIQDLKNELSNRFSGTLNATAIEAILHSLDLAFDRGYDARTSEDIVDLDETDDSTYATPSVQYPNVTVSLVGEDGNTFNLIAKVAQAIRIAEGDYASNNFTNDAMDSGSYDELLVFIKKTVNVV